MSSITDEHNWQHRREMGIAHALSQDHHARINARFPGLTREHCFLCDQETGRAGRGEDSMFDDNDDGPYCEECRELHADKFAE